MRGLRRVLAEVGVGMLLVAAPCLAQDVRVASGTEGIPVPVPTAVAPPTPAASPTPAPGTTARPLPAWVLVRLPDGRPAWAPSSSLLVTSWQPQPRERVLEVARRLIGVPYRWGGETPNGVDCSGFVEEVFRICGHSLPRLADAQHAFCAEVPADDLKAGDLVFFTTYLPGPSHVGIYTGDGRFVHASSSRGVTVSSLEEPYYAGRYLGARRPPAWGGGGPPLSSGNGSAPPAPAVAIPAPAPTPQAPQR